LRFWFSLCFSFYSLRPVARLGQEAVDEAVERSESWGWKWAAHRSACWQPMVALSDGRVLMAAASVCVGIFMFICPYQT
jgi:hypothetical protein